MLPSETKMPSLVRQRQKSAHRNLQTQSDPGGHQRSSVASAHESDRHTKACPWGPALRLSCDSSLRHPQVSSPKKIILKPPWRANPNVLCTHISFGMCESMDFSERIGRRLKLQDLHILMTVAQVGSMGTAARRLNTTQPAVSRTIAELESAVGVRLFDRSPQGVEPTACGRALLHCSATVFDNLRQGVRNIEFLNNPTLGEIRIGTDEPTVAGLLSTMLGRLHRRYPGITVHMAHLGELEQQQRELRERRIDLVIGRLGSNVEGDVETQILYQDSICVVAGSQIAGVRGEGSNYPNWRTNRGAFYPRILLSALLSKKPSASGEYLCAGR